MSLKLKFDSDLKVVRSIGDPPNGILGVSSEASDGEPLVTFMIDPSWEPPPPPADAPSHVVAHGRKSSGDTFPIAVDDAVEACDGAEELRSLYQAALAGLMASIEVYAGSGRIERIELHVDLLKEVRDEINDMFEE